MYQNIYYERQKNLIHLWDDKSGYQTFHIESMHINEIHMVSTFLCMVIN